MDPFVQQLSALCLQHPTRAKWVFVPTHGVGRTLGERLALSGTNWLNLRFITPLEIALRMGAPFLVERGIDPSEEGLGPALIMRLLLDLPEAGGLRARACGGNTRGRILGGQEEHSVADLNSRLFVDEFQDTDARQGSAPAPGESGRSTVWDRPPRTARRVATEHAASSLRARIAESPHGAVVRRFA
jgi:hypothetical protein